MKKLIYVLKNAVHFYFPMQFLKKKVMFSIRLLTLKAISLSLSPSLSLSSLSFLLSLSFLSLSLPFSLFLFHTEA